MTPEEAENLRQRVRALENLTANLIFNGRYRFLKDVEFGPNAHLVSSLGKLGFFGTAPVVQAAAISQPTSAGAGYNQAVAQTSVAAINAILIVLKAYGLTK